MVYLYWCFTVGLMISSMTSLFIYFSLSLFFLSFRDLKTCSVRVTSLAYFESEWNCRARDKFSSRGMWKKSLAPCFQRLVVSIKLRTSVSVLIEWFCQFSLCDVYLFFMSLDYVIFQIIFKFHFFYFIFFISIISIYFIYISFFCISLFFVIYFIM